LFFVGNKHFKTEQLKANPAQANTPYNGNENNNSLWMGNIDIDGDPLPLSSSMP